MESKTDKSFGIIPITKVEGKWKVFLIHQFSRIGNNSYWIFPKGHSENSETQIETAKRELFEEVGMTADRILPEPTFSLKYVFSFDGVRINKEVIFYLGIISDTKINLQTSEVKEAGWYTIEEAAERLDYQDTKSMFVEVKQFLEQYSG
ncbi:NUDIX domain-containing protein [Candidatus Kaiserbacteria bacterium]|nr:NUDIX domain-containing protein [Candidatus Kaiserbacteria bacterium]